MTKYIQILLFPIVALLMSACGNGSFTIEGKLSDAGTQNLRFVYLSDGKINSEWTPSVGGAFKMQGNSNELTVVYIFTSKMKFITHVAVENGDKVEINGSIADNYKINVTGTDTNEQWNLFMRQNAADFINGNSANIDKSIAEYVRTNSDNVVSTLLLTCDYSDFNNSEAKKLLETIDEDAKPEQLLELYGSEMQHGIEKSKRITPLNLRDERDSLALLDIKKHPANVIYFWFDNNEKHKEAVRELRNLSKKSGKVAIADVCMNPDTALWRQTIKSDSTKWKHYKAFGGPTDRSINDLGIRGGNFLIVADSAGTQAYRGTSAKEASAAVDKLIK